MTDGKWGSIPESWLTAILARSDESWRRGDTEAALDALDQAYTRTSADPLAIARIALVHGRLLHDSGELGRAAHLYRTTCARAAERSAHAGARVLRLQALIGLGTIARLEGHYDQAEQVLRQVLAAADKWATDPHDIARACNELAVTFKYSGNFDEAAGLYQRALRLLETALGPDHVELATIYHNIGGLAHARGDYAAAESSARRAVTIRERALGPDHVTVATDQAALAPILLELGQLDEADQLLHSALTIFEHTYGPNHYEVAVTLNNLAAIARRREHLPEAEHLFRRSLHIKEKLLGAEHPDLAPTLVNLALLRRLNDDLIGASELYGRAFTILSGVVEETHPTLTVIRNALTALRAIPGFKVDS